MSYDEFLDELIRELEHLGNGHDEATRKAKSFLTYLRRSEFTACLEKFVIRQCTIMPDFEALYKKKAAIDSRLLDESHQ